MLRFDGYHAEKFLPVYISGRHDDDVMLRHKFRHSFRRLAGLDYAYPGVCFDQFDDDLAFFRVSARGSDGNTEIHVFQGVHVQRCHKGIDAFVGCQASREQHPSLAGPAVLWAFYLGENRRSERIYGGHMAGMAFQLAAPQTGCELTGGD